MKFSRKYLILLFTLIVLIAVAGFMLWKDLKVVRVPDFVNSTKDDVQTWCTSLKENPCELSQEYSDTVAKDGVIYQSIKADEKLDGVISFKISLGQKPVVKMIQINQNTTKNDIELWAKENNLKNVEYIQQDDSQLPKGAIIKIESSDPVVNADSNIKVYISSGTAIAISQNGEIEIKKDEYVGLREADFKNKTTSAGLKPTYNSDRDAYSSTIEKGKIVWHGSGIYEKEEKITYGLSLGKNSNAKNLYIKKDEFTSLSENDFIAKTKELGLKAVKTADHEDYSNSISKGKVIWHGYGDFEEDEINIRYSLSLGTKETSNDDLNIEKNEYVGLSEKDFVAKAQDLGLKAIHNKEWDEYSDTVSKGIVVWHGYGEYDKGENFKYGLSLGKEDGSQPIGKQQYIAADTFTNISEDDFIAKVKQLGLTAKKTSDYEDYSDTIDKDLVIWHGHGYFEADETTIRYSLSLGKKDTNVPVDRNVKKNQYVGLSESEFISKAKEMGLNAYHNTIWDEYSDTVNKGIVVWHGYGEYDKGEDFKYGLSLGKKESSDPSQSSAITINKDTYINISENDFITKTKQLGLNPEKTSEHEDYSSTVSKGNVVWHGAGQFQNNETIRYSLSNGPKPVASAYLNSFNDISTLCLADNYEAGKKKVSDYLSNAGFTNFSFSGQESRDYSAGVLLSITVDEKKHTMRTSYPLDAQIVVTISSGLMN